MQSMIHWCESPWALQDVYQQTHPVLFSDRALYVVVYSLRAQSLQHDVPRHIQNIAVRCPVTPILVVGTHADAIGVASEELSLSALRATFPQVQCTHLFFLCGALFVETQLEVEHLDAAPTFVTLRPDSKHQRHCCVLHNWG
jgi:hypothetical protein